jgi:hypothetical protein
MKKFILLYLLLTSGSFLSCSGDELLDKDIPTNVFVDSVKVRNEKSMVYNTNYHSKIIVVGDTVLSQNYKRLVRQPYVKENESILKSGIEDEDLIKQPIRVLAQGTTFYGTLAFNNETIEYSISNLIAKQMGVDFSNPYFDAQDFNGAYTLVPTGYNPTGGPVTKMKTAKNNLGIDHFDKNGVPVLKKVKIDRIDNFVTFGFGLGSTSENNTEFNRLNSRLNYEQNILSQKFHFMIDISGHDQTIMEKGLEGYIPRRPLGGLSDFYYRSEKLDMYSDIIKRKNVKGILINSVPTTPNLANNIVPVNNVRKELAKYNLEHLLSSTAKQMRTTARIDSLMGFRVNMHSKPYVKNREEILSFYDWEPEAIIESYERPRRSKLSEQMNWPELDVNFIFTQIYLGKYFTHDGVQVRYEDLFEDHKLSYKKITNILIANEALMTINKYYGTKYPLINTSEFLK